MSIIQEDASFFLNGYKRFYNKFFQEEKSLYRDLVKHGQSPKALVISCSDSRVDPSILMDCSPGDLFVIRNVANLIPPYEPDNNYHGISAALEFGVCVLQIPQIIILGHTQCGGIINLIKDDKETVTEHSFVRKWVNIAKQAKVDALQLITRNEQDLVDTCGRYAILYSVKNALSFPWIKERVCNETLTIHAWNFNLHTGALEILDSTTKTFKSLEIT